IRTPLNAVLGLADIVLEGSLDPQQRDAMESIKISAEALLAIINDILDFSKIEAGKLELSSSPFSLKDTLLQLEKMFSYRVEQKQMTFVIELHPDVPDLIKGDPLRLQQVLINLVGNALKFTPEKGGILLYVSLISKKDNDIVIGFDVCDSGIGIDLKAQKTIFDAFVQAQASTTRQFGGTGLGLAISQRLVEAMGGELHVRSIPKRGSSFRFSAVFGSCGKEDIELLNQKQRKERQPEEAKETSNPKPTQVLLVEDNEMNQKLVLYILKKAGFDATLAKNGEEAIKLYEKQTFDVILMDVQMPVLDGYAATKTIRAIEEGSNSHVPIIAMTAHALDFHREKCLKAGMDDYISKPINRQLLIEKITKASQIHN
ncbi:MAG: response regulator, partial [SAR324 cluster bacterium]|nr:response regulator [SAR324 cluster bacterium]